MEVKCPMCETPGFVLPRYAGELVKCGNPKCLVPVFTAPAIKAESPVAEPVQKKSLSPNAILFSIVGVVVAVAAGAFFVFFSGPPNGGQVKALTAEQKAQIEEAKKQRELQEKEREEKAKQAANKTETPENTAAVKAASAQAAFDKLVAEWPEQMLTAVRTSAANRIASGRRWAGLALAAKGDLASAGSQVDQAVKIAGAAAYESIVPLISIYWKQVEAADSSSTVTLDRAVALASGLPKSGRIPADCRVTLATALAHAGRHAEAIKVLAEGEQPANAIDHLAAVQQAARATTAFSLQQANWPGRTTVVNDQPHRWSAPRTAGVLLALANRGHGESMVDFALAQTSTTLRFAAARVTGAILSRFESAFADKRAAFTAKLVGAMGNSPAAKLSLLAAQGGWDPAGRGDILTQIDAIVASAKTSDSPQISGAKSILEAKLPDGRGEQLSLAIAMAEASTLYSRDEKARPKGAELMAKALQLARSVAPSPSVMLDRKRDVDRTPSTELRNRLRGELELKTNDAAERKVVEYRAQVEKLYKAAVERFDTTCEILLMASAAGRGDLVRAELERSISANDLNSSEPYDRSTLPFLLEASAVSGLDPLIEAPLDQRLNPTGCSVALMERDAETHDINELVAALNSPANKEDAYDELGFRRVEALVRSGKYDDAIAFIAAVGDLGFQEEALWIAGAVAGKERAADLWKVTEPRIVKDQPLRAAAISGLIYGVSAAPAK